MFAHKPLVEFTTWGFFFKKLKRTFLKKIIIAKIQISHNVPGYPMPADEADFKYSVLSDVF